MIKKLSLPILASLNLQAANVSLAHLMDYEKEICLEKLEEPTEQEMWDIFLKGQSELLFKTHFFWIENTDWWQKARTILEMGSGNGAFLYKLSECAKTKIYFGLEKQSLFVEKAIKDYADTNASFLERDVEVFDKSFVDTADLIIFCLTLEHLKKPVIALENAWNYLLPDGYILIIDSYDKATRTSHPLETYLQAISLLRESGDKLGTIHRTITLEVMNEITQMNSPLSKLYEVVFSNLDRSGNVLHDTPHYSTDEERVAFFNHILLFLTILKRFYHLPFDLRVAYDELKEYVRDKNAWTTIGCHYLVLKKKY